MKVTVVSGQLTKATAGSVGFDLHSTEDVLLVPNSVMVVGTGVRLKMEGCYALMFDRSGLAAKWGVSRRAGVIDTDYADEVKAIMANDSGNAYCIHKGDRIAQLIFVPLPEIEVVGDGVVESEAVRNGGFGSTGTN